MAIFKPFKGLRPPKEIVKNMASRPYDVLNSEEARVEAQNNPYSFLRVVKPEIELPADTYLYSEEVYAKALENFHAFINKGWLTQDHCESYYIYAQTWGVKIQYGIVGCAGVEDYMNNIIRKHELTRPDKEEDRMKHVRTLDANAEPVFFAYPAIEEIDRLVREVTKNEPEYDFISDDGFGHKFWVVDKPELVNKIQKLFEKVPYIYVADGHHRTAAAALVGNEKKLQNPNHKGTEDYNYFMAVLFPDDQLTIIDYNRVATDLNGLTVEEFLKRLEDVFEITPKGKDEYKPKHLHNFGMYLDGAWYELNARENTYDDSDPIGILDVTILSQHVLDHILGIKNLRTDKRIDFVGGIRGLKELKRRVDSGEMAVAFALYPVTMKQIINIADSGKIMPPKTTWFEPKLRSGLVVHKLHD
jgi:uncharacterized protein (DUF1015 family)